MDMSANVFWHKEYMYQVWSSSSRLVGYLFVIHNKKNTCCGYYNYNDIIETGDYPFSIELLFDTNTL